MTGDLYASSDFGVSTLADGSTSLVLAASGMPNVEVAGLTIVPGERKLFAGHARTQRLPSSSGRDRHDE